MKATLMILMLFAVTVIGYGMGATQDVTPSGAEHITLYGGSTGSVPFPHHRHQKALTDCNTCHVLFPQQNGVIEIFKTNGKLQKKQIMNSQCTQCHRERKAEGKPAGPTTCKGCHVK